MKYLILALFLVGCADNVSKMNDSYPKRQIVTAALDSLNTIVPKCMLNRNINIVFDVDTEQELSSATLGICHQSDDLHIHNIVLNYKAYMKYNSTTYYLEKLILHELGHCEYGLGHTPGTLMAATADDIYFTDKQKVELMKKFEASYCN